MAATIFNARSLQEVSRSDIIKRRDPSGAPLAIAEVLAQKNEWILDAPSIEGTGDSTHTIALRTALPKVYFKKFNYGVPASKSDVARFQEACGMIEARSIVDSQMLKLHGNPQEFRAGEDKAFIEAMGQHMARQIFYGQQISGQESFTGLAPRYATFDLEESPSAYNVIDGGLGEDLSEKTDLTSVWVIAWGDNVGTFYPKNSAAGLEMIDLGEDTVYDEYHHPYQAYQTIFRWSCGLYVKNWRYVARICNISLGDLRSGVGIGNADLRTPGTSNLIMLINEALMKIPSNSEKFAICMNSACLAGLNILDNRQNYGIINTHEHENTWGEHGFFTTFDHIPLRRVDQISAREEWIDNSVLTSSSSSSTDTDTEEETAEAETDSSTTDTTE